MGLSIEKPFFSLLDLTQNSDSLSDGSLDLLVELVNAYVVDESLDGVIIIHALEDCCYIDLDEDIVVGGARPHLQVEHYVLLGHQVLDLGLTKFEIKS